jgi:hypothetical protein
MSVPVCWLSLNPEAPAGEQWDTTILHDLFDGKGEFWQTRLSFTQTQCGCGEHLPRYGGIVVLPGQHQNDAQAEQVIAAVCEMDWALVIVSSDEEARFPLDWFPQDDERREVWVQYRDLAPANRLLPCGYPPGLREFARRRASMRGDHLADDIPVFFAGQDTNERRHDFFRAVHRSDWPEGACFIATDGFGPPQADGQPGLAQKTYWEQMMRARFCPAPAGIVSVDSFRLYEALELGRAPIVEDSTDAENQGSFWKRLFPEGMPFPQVDTWDELPSRLADASWPEAAFVCSAWWQAEKRRIAEDLAATVERLRG